VKRTLDERSLIKLFTQAHWSHLQSHTIQKRTAKNFWGVYATVSFGGPRCHRGSEI